MIRYPEPAMIAAIRRFVAASSDGVDPTDAATPATKHPNTAT
jgi:hypothetical protein